MYKMVVLGRYAILGFLAILSIALASEVTYAADKDAKVIDNHQRNGKCPEKSTHIQEDDKGRMIG